MILKGAGGWGICGDIGQRIQSFCYVGRKRSGNRMYSLVTVVNNTTLCLLEIC